MLILGIETSCDETAVAIVKDGTLVHSNIIASSAKDQAEFGGVFPEVAARKQLECMTPAIDQAFQDANVSQKEIDAIAVTKGPGLLTSLLVGVTAARVLASTWNKPLIGVHHTMGHLSSTWLENVEWSEGACSTPGGDVPRFPILTLSVSGGHTDLWLRHSHTRGVLLGATRDDAAGEAFDKGATLLGLPYPGGPALARLAEGGNPHFIDFPRPLLGEETCSFSFSGLKTSLKYAIRDRGGIDALSEAEKKDIAASFQEAICNHLASRIEHALTQHQEITEIHLVGGVSANVRLWDRVSLTGASHSLPLRIPATMAYCTDNAAMIASAAEFMYREIGEKAYASFATGASLSL
jgi:N6-L-threonylcarbamoyladenine synthase